ncbi:MAG: AraC family transcriptional regulator [Planctomycetota bacterium]
MSAKIWNRFQHAVFKPPAAMTPAVLVAASYERTCSNQETVSHCCHENWVLDCSWTPGLYIRIGSASEPMQLRPPGRVHCYAPGTRYWEDCRSLSGRRISGQYLVVRDRVGVLSPLITKGAALVDDGDGRLRAILQEAFAVSGAPSFWRCQALWCTLVETLLMSVPISAGHWHCGATAAAANLGAQVEELLRNDLTSPICLEGLARSLGISPSSLSHRFRAETGESVMGRLRRLRVERALAMLPHGHRLDDVAQACGFCDRFHLAKAVSRITGRPPSAWRTAPTSGMNAATSVTRRSR